MSLKKLQKKSGITPDGIFGKNTFKHCSCYLGIDNHINAVHFWAQVGHETGNFKFFKENLNYSADALLRVFGKYFKDKAQAKEYARNPEKIANRVYSNRMGNGDELSGDGFKYRGRGALQLTGKDNYEAFANYMRDMSILNNPKVVATDLAFQSAMFFFDKNNVWSLAKDFSEDSIRKVTRRINGGFNGLDHRIELTEKYKKYSL